MLNAELPAAAGRGIGTGAVDQTIVAVRGLHFAWGARAVLRGIDLAIGRGELVGLLGPNGSGKSTLLRLIGGTLSASAGELVVAGVRPGRGTRGALARRVASVAQSPVVPEAFTVADLVLLGRTPHLRLMQREGAHDYAAARRALLAAGCLELAERRLGELSGGERQRAALARALAQEPELLLLDEPTAHLDPGVGQEIAATLARLNRDEGLTVVAALHDVNLAAAICPRLLLLHEGRIIADGPPAAVITPPLLRRAYGYDAQVLPHPETGLPVAVPSYGRTPTA